MEMEGREYILREALKEVQDTFDYVLIDCPPSLGILTLNSLVAADTVLIPLQCEYYALEGLNQLLRIITMVQENLNRKLKIEGVVLTMYDSRTNLAQQVVQDVRDFFEDKVFETIIPRNVRLSEAPSFGKPIGIYDRGSVGSQTYEKLTDEVIGHG
jgi:chromosome partitioning protein